MQGNGGLSEGLEEDLWAAVLCWGGWGKDGARGGQEPGREEQEEDEEDDVKSGGGGEDEAVLHALCASSSGSCMPSCLKTLNLPISLSNFNTL